MKNETSVNVKIKKEWAVIAIFIALVAMFYGNTLKNGFIYDDNLVVEKNEYVHSMEYLPKVVTGCIWEHTFGQCEGRSLYYRPMQSLSYLITFQISSEPWVFHLVNLIYFTIIISLIFFLAKILTNNFLLSFFAALIFLIHPINSEVVNWISAVPELTYTIFALLSAIFFIKFRKTEKDKNLWLAAIFYFLSILSKETAMFLPLIFIILDLTFFKKSVNDFLEWKEFKNYLILAGSFAITMIMRIAVLGSISSGKNPFGDFSFTERIHSFFSLSGIYSRMLLYPNPLNFFHYFEKSSDFFNPQFFLSFIAVLLFFAAIFFSLRNKNNIAVFSLSWMILFLFPVLIFIGSTGESVYSERYLFAPAIGFSLIVGYLLANLWKKREKIRVWIAVFLVLISGLSWYVVYNRNTAWKENVTFYTDTLAKNPKATPIKFNYAIFLRNNERNFEEAKKHFEEIIERNPNWADISLVYMHLGDYYYFAGEEEKAVEYYNKSATVSDDWKTHFAYNKLGILYAEKEEYLKALTNFCQAFQINPESEGVGANFDKIISMVESTYEDEELYNEIINSGAFVKSSDKKIRFRDKTCRDEACVFVFSLEFSEEEYEVILPILITAYNSENEAIKIEKSAFNPEINGVMLEVGPKYNEEDINFIFPTCKGIYYEVKITSEN